MELQRNCSWGFGKSLARNNQRSSRMKNLALIVLASLGMMLPIGCTSSNPPPPIVNTIVCDAQTALSNLAGAAIATKLVCANQAAVQASVLAVLQQANLCTQTSATAKKALKGPIANALCPSLVAGI